MADYAIHDTTLTAISNVIRKKDGTSALIDPADYADRINLMGMLEEKTTSGSIANFSDGADTVPLKSLSFDIEPIQASGTPSPSNPLPISGHTSLTAVHCGKNLLDDSKTYQRNANTLRLGTDTLDGRLTLKAGTYTLSITSDVAIGNLVYTIGGTSTTISHTASGTRYYGSFTLSDDTDDIFLHVYKSGGITSENVSDIMLEVGNQATTYAPYSAESKKWEFPPFGKNLVDGTDFTQGLPSTTIGASIDTISSSTRYAYYGASITGGNYTISSVSTDSDYYNAILIFGYSNGVLSVYTSGTVNGNKTVDLSGCDYIRIAIGTRTVSYIVPTDFTPYGTIQCESGSTATAYEPYQEAYTGSLNALTGAMERTSKKKMLNKFTWYKDTYEGHTIFRATIDDGASEKGSQFIGMCSTYLRATDTNTDKTIRFFSNLLGCEAWIRDDDYSSYTGDEFQEAVQGYIIYELATPTEITLDSVNWQTKLGDNNFYCDCGTTELTYRSSGTIQIYPEGEGVSF